MFDKQLLQMEVMIVAAHCDIADQSHGYYSYSQEVCDDGSGPCYGVCFVYCLSVLGAMHTCVALHMIKSTPTASL